METAGITLALICLSAFWWIVETANKEKEEQENDN